MNAKEDSIKVEQVHVLDYIYNCPAQPVSPGKANLGPEGSKK